MNINDLKAAKPSIKLYYSEQLADKKVIESILYGAEEEGIPVEVVGSSERDFLNLAHKASMDSNLSTGIGVNDTMAAVHYGKLPIHSPVFQVSVNAGEDALRKVGSNGARLVKRLPLRISAD